MTLHWEYNLVAIFLLPENKMQLRYWYYLILHHINCITHSQILLTFDPQDFQGHTPFKFLQFLIISRRQGRKMALTSLNVYTTSHLLSQTSLCFAPLASGPNFGSSDSIGSLKVNLRWPSTGCLQIQTTQWIVWIWFIEIDDSNFLRG